MTRRGCAAGCVVVSALYGHARDQAYDKRLHAAARVMQIAYRRIDIKLQGSPASGVTIPIGAKHLFANRFRLGPHALLANEAMRNQLTRLLAMPALRSVQLPGLLLNGLKAGVVDSHERT